MHTFLFFSVIPLDMGWLAHFIVYLNLKPSSIQLTWWWRLGPMGTCCCVSLLPWARADNESDWNESCHFELHHSNLNNVKKLKAPGDNGSYFSHLLMEGSSTIQEDQWESLVLREFAANAALCPTCFWGTPTTNESVLFLLFTYSFIYLLTYLLRTSYCGWEVESKMGKPKEPMIHIKIKIATQNTF